MTSPETSTTPPSAPRSPLMRVARVLWIAIGVIVALIVLGAVLGSKKKMEEQSSNAPQVQPAPVQATSPTANSTPTSVPPQPQTLTTKDRLVLVEAELARREQHVERLVADLWRKVDANGEGMETKSEITLIVRNLQQGQEQIALSVLERSTKIRVRMLRKEFIEIRDAQRLVATTNEERGVLLRKLLDEKKEQAEAERAAQSRAVGVQVPAAPATTPDPAPTAAPAP